MNLEVDVRDVLPTISAPALVMSDRMSLSRRARWRAGATSRADPRGASPRAARRGSRRRSAIRSNWSARSNASSRKWCTEIARSCRSGCSQPCSSPTSSAPPNVRRARRPRLPRELLVQHHAAVRSQLARFRGGDGHSGGRLFRHLRRPGSGDPLCVRDPRKCPRAGARGTRRPAHRRVRAARRQGWRHRRAHRRPRRWAGRFRRVLVSNTVKDLVAGSGIGFEDRGEAALKGVPGEWRLFAVSYVPEA